MNNVHSFLNSLRTPQSSVPPPRAALSKILGPHIYYSPRFSPLRTNNPDKQALQTAASAIENQSSTNALTFDSISNIKEPTRGKFRNPQTNSIHTVQVLPESYAYYVHTKTPKDQWLCSGTTKTCKFAERHLTQIPNTDFSSAESVARLVAKIIPKRESLIRSNHQAFLNLLPQLKDIPGIVQHYDHAEAVNKRGEKQFVYYQEKYTESLFEFLRLHKKPLSNAQLKKITGILLSTLHALHQKRIYHRDLKIENVLIDLSKETPVALCDFDTAFQHGMSETRRNQRCGTWTTRSPETTRAYLQSNRPRFEEKDLAANDVWGMGMILHSLYTHKEFPFDLDGEKEETELRQRIGSLQQEDIRLKPKVTGIDDKIDPIIYSMLQTDPSKRISAEKALKQFQAL